jgi:hypothetical protein
LLFKSKLIALLQLQDNHSKNPIIHQEDLKEPIEQKFGVNKYTDSDFLYYTYYNNFW